VPKKLSKLQQKLMNDLSKEDTAESLWYSILIDSYFYNLFDPFLFSQSSSSTLIFATISLKTLN
jgi:hypothetical protein